MNTIEDSRRWTFVLAGHTLLMCEWHRATHNQGPTSLARYDGPDAEGHSGDQDKESGWKGTIRFEILR